MTTPYPDSSSEEARKVSSEPESLRNTTSRAVAWNVAFVPLLAILSLLSSALVARALSLEEYRVYGLAAAAIASLLLWSDLGISSAVARFTPELLRIGPGAAGAFLRVAARTRLLVLALIVGLLLIARYRWSAMETVLPFRDASLLFIVMAVTLQSLARIHQYFLTGLFQRKTIGVILLVASGAQSALVILAVLLDTGVTGILGAMALAALVELPLSRAASKSRGAFVAQDPSSPLPQDLVRDARRFGLTSFLEKLLSHLNSPFFVVFLIAALGTAQDVAFFTVAAEFTMRVASTLSVPFSGITLPLFSAVDARKDPRQSASILRLYVMLMILLFIPMAALLTSVAPFLLPLVYGIRYSEAVPILQLFVPLLFLEYTVYSALSAALMTRGRYKQVLIAKLPLLVGVPAVGLAIPRWGAAGAVVAFGATRVLSAAWLLWTGIRQLHFRFPVTFAAKVLLASVGATVPVLIVGRRLSAGWFSLALLLALGLAFFLALYRVFGGMAAEDRNAFLSGMPASASWISRLL